LFIRIFFINIISIDFVINTNPALENPFLGSPEAEVSGIWKFSVDGKIPTGDVRFTDGGKVEFKPNGKPYGDSAGSWVIDPIKDELVAKFGKYTLNMVRDQDTGGWTLKEPKPGKPVTKFLGGRLKHTTRRKALIIGKWKWKSSSGKIKNGEIHLKKNGKLRYRRRGRQFRTVGKWKIKFNKITLYFYKEVFKFTFNKRTGWKCTSKGCNYGVNTPKLTHNPFFGQPEAQFLGDWEITDTATT
jgi:hypothetical protein